MFTPRRNRKPDKALDLNQENPGPPQLRLESLEPRIMYDASPLIAALQGIVDAEVQGNTSSIDSLDDTFGWATNPWLEEIAIDPQFSSAAESSVDFTLNANSALDSDNDVNTSAQSANEHSFLNLGFSVSDFPSIATESVALRREIAFVDTGIFEYEKFVNDLLATSSTLRQVDVILIDHREDGLAQINQYLATYNPESLDAIHILSHGTERALKLGSTWFDADALESRAGEFAAWSDVLTADADLLFYGCELAKDQAGRDILGMLATWTRADVAASETLVGAESLGGNWLLEYQIGEIDTQVLVSASLQADWFGLLDTFTVTNANNSGAGSLRQAILDANALAGHDTINFAIGAAGSFQTIVLGSTLTITDSVTINGQSQAAGTYDGQPLIYVRRHASTTVNTGFHVQASNVTITGIGVAGFSQDGILVENASNFTLTNSAIGVNPSTLVQNSNSRDGIRLNNVTNSIIGGTNFADRNFIAFSGQYGVNVLGSSNNVALLGNLFQGSTTLDLDLGGDGVTANDGLDGDSGPNGLQNFPVLSSAQSSQTGTRVTGNFNSNANTTYRIEVFGTMAGSEHSSGYGGGRTFLGAFNVTTDGIGNASFDMTLQGWVNAGDRVTATATVDLGGGQFGSTSEFSQQVIATSSGVVVVNTNVNTSDGNTSSIANLQANRGTDGRISLLEAIVAANNTANTGGVPDLIAFDILSWSTVTITVTGSNLATITDAVRIDGSTQRGYSGTPKVAIVNGDSRTIGLEFGGSSGGSTIRSLNIRGFSTAGINIGTGNNTIVGNYIGTNFAGTSAAGNYDGINIYSGNNNIIGGTDSIDRNVISGNTNNGIVLTGGSNNTQIIGNFIGLNAAGSAALGNGSLGIYAGNVSGLVIGGTTASHRNVISGNTAHGIMLDSNTSNSQVLGNFIGTDSTGVLNLGNGVDGILVTNGANNITIGGTAAGAGNTIAFNGRDGVRIDSTAGNGNAILGNHIYSNAGLGINLVGGSQDAFGVTANDLGDGDSGPNGLQNFPIVSSATIDGTNITVAGTLNSTASRTFRIEVFASTTVDASGYGEGQRYLGTFNVTTNGSGNVSFDQTLTGVSVAVDDYITFTATDLTTNNTSEFSYAVMATLLANSAPSALSVTRTRQGGLEINHGAGNDTYLVANNGGTILGGRTALTMEFQFELAEANVQHTFLNYAVSGMDNEVYLNTLANGDLRFFIKGASVTSSAVNFNSLVGTGPHTLSVTWSNAGGAWVMYLDGVQFASGSGLQNGATLAGGGSLVIGHDQDSVGGGFQSHQAFKGTLYDARIFNSVRSGSQVFASHQATLPYFESGMVANWTFNDLSSGGVVIDTVFGNNLTLQHATGAGFVADSPTLTLRIAENSANGTVVGTVLGIDLEREARITQLLAADPMLRYAAETGKFYKLVSTTATWTTAQANAISTTLGGVAGQLLTIQNAYENELARQFAVSIGGQVWLGYSDQDVEGDWRVYSGTTAGDLIWQGTWLGYRINGTYTNWNTGEPNNNSNEDFAILRSTDGTWNDLAGNSERYIIEWDADAVLDATNAVFYSITSQTVGGAFAINTSTGVITVANGSLLDFETHASHTIIVRVTDGDGEWIEQAFMVELQDVAIEPSLQVPGSQTLDEDTSIVFSVGNGNAIIVTDQNASTNGLLQVHLQVPNGTLTLSNTSGLTFVSGNNNSGSMVINGTESDINAALNGLTYTPSMDFHGTVHLQIAVLHENGLEGLYEFNGNANDTSIGITHSGTLVGNAAIVNDPQRGQVLSLDGVNDGVEIAGLFGQPQNVTLAAWVNLNVPDTQGAEVISLGNSVMLRLDRTGGAGVQGSFYNGSTWLQIDTGVSLAQTGWNHVAFTFDDVNNIQRLYINGQLVATANFVDSIAYTLGTSTRIGMHGGASSVYDFNGLIDDARIYTRALTADEVAALATGNIGQSETIALTVNPVNDAPVFSNLNGTPTFTENGLAVVLDSDVSIFDVELSGINNFNGSSLTLVRNGGANAEDIFSATGTLSLTGGNVIVSGTTIGTFTQSNGQLTINFNNNATNTLVNQAMQQIAYSNTSDAPPASVQVDWTFSDGNNGDQGSGGALTATGNVIVTITAINDAPILDNSGDLTLNTIDEDEVNNSGQTVASILASDGGTPITDPDGPSSLQGIAITATNNGNGTWQYSVNGGAAWLNIGTVSNTSALLLRDTDLVRFIPNGENGTIADFTFRAWDQTSGTFGSKVDTSVNGGSTAFSTATETASIVVTDVNDAPTVDPNPFSIGATDEDTISTPIAVSSVLGGAGYADVDNGALSGLAITALSGDGTWQYSTDGTTWSDIAAVSGTNALLLASSSQIRYIPNGINGETATFAFRAWDQTSGVPSTNGTPAYANPGSGGGTTAFSSATATAQLTVTDVNDAPVISVEPGDSDSDTISESNSTLQTQGTLTVIDVDIADTVTAAVTGVVASGTTTGLLSNNAALLAMLSVNANVIDGTTQSGTITWTFDSGSEAFDYLAVGESLILTYTIRAEDSQGAFDTQEVTITITGTNDAPVISVEVGDSAGDTLSVDGSTLT
ncbi:MAG TPA: DUF4347 domain-containing protein, partial [Pirellulaceae bacterium]|nr:DUF4347 domain-containing protein [Pirellulaceae bacterium]